MLFYVFFVLFYVFLCCSMYYLFCVVLCIVCVYMCTVLLPPGRYPIAVKYIIAYSECLFVVVDIQHAMRMSHIVICGLPRSTIFCHFISYTVRFSEKRLLNMQCFLIFSTDFSETFLILRRIQQNIIKNVHRS